jgi:hypothetical protein
MEIKVILYAMDSQKFARSCKTIRWVVYGRMMGEVEVMPAKLNLTLDPKYQLLHVPLALARMTAATINRFVASVAVCCSY